MPLQVTELAGAASVGEPWAYACSWFIFVKEVFGVQC